MSPAVMKTEHHFVVSFAMLQGALHKTFPADLIKKFAEEILNGKRHFLCSGGM